MTIEDQTIVAPDDIGEIVRRLGSATQQLEGKRVLLAGGCGFLGRYFLEVFTRLNAEVLEQPVSVVAMDNLITAAGVPETFSDNPHLEFVEHNIIEPWNPGGRFDHIIHAAGIASPFYYRAHPLETLDVAISGTRNLLDLAREGQSHFVYFSSSEIYGDPDPAHVPTPESYCGNVSCVGPRACYDEGKRVGETLCQIYHNVHGVSVNVIRPFNIYGPGMKERDFRVLPNFASRIQGGQPLQIYGTGKQTRTYCYITDAMVGFLKVLLLGAPGETYNIGNTHPEVSVQDLVKAMEAALGRAIASDNVEHPDSYPADEPQRRCPNLRKANLQLEYQPEVELEDGLGRFLNWTQQHYTGEL
jgi:UDP-glucuronate decarboxylase